jgi:serine/threonine-protein kinase
MLIASTGELLEAIREAGLLDDAQFADMEQTSDAHSAEPREIARALLKAGWLTAFQLNQLLQGRGGRLVIGPYRLLERIGEGGAGEVFKARHYRLRRVAAIKLVRRERLSDARVLARFQREAEAAAQLAHPNIVTLYDADWAGDVYFLAMEYVDGVDLGRLVRDSGPLSVARACEYTRQAALGLHHAHERGLVHRDVKPANLLLGNDGVVKVLDLGIARLHASDAGARPELTQAGVVVGTVDYLAPEQAKDARTADRRADVYGLGCTLYHLLTGRPPFAEGATLDKLLRHQTEPPQPLRKARPDAPPGVAAVVERLLAKRPDDRFQTMAVVAAALGALAAKAAKIDTPMPGASRTRAAAKTIKVAVSPSALASNGKATVRRRAVRRPPTPVPAPPPPAPRRAQPSNRRKAIFLILAFGAAVLALGLVLRFYLAPQ